MALPPPWLAVSHDSGLRESLSAELRRECGPEHLLAARAFTCSARCEGCDAALFELDGGEWAVVHLTYAASEPDPRWPSVEALGSWEDVLSVIEEHSAGSH